ADVRSVPKCGWPQRKRLLLGSSCRFPDWRPLTAPAPAPRGHAWRWSPAAGAASPPLAARRSPSAVTLRLFWLHLGGAQDPGEPGRDHWARRGQVMDGGPAEPEQCRVDAAPQDVEHILYAGLPVG